MRKIIDFEKKNIKIHTNTFLTDFTKQDDFKLCETKKNVFFYIILQKLYFFIGLSFHQFILETSKFV